MLAKNKWLLAGFSSVLISGAILWEGTRYTPYEDMVGVLTVCHGYTGKDIVVNKRYTPQECENLLNKELYKHGRGLLECITVPLKRHQFDGIMLFGYNIGVDGACSSRAVRLINQGRYDEGCEAISHGPTGKPAWSYVNGNVFVQGLYNRRLYETKLCKGELNAKYGG